MTGSPFRVGRHIGRLIPVLIVTIGTVVNGQVINGEKHLSSVRPVATSGAFTSAAQPPARTHLSNPKNAPDLKPVPIPATQNGSPFVECDECQQHAPDFRFRPTTSILPSASVDMQNCQARGTIRPQDELWWVSSRHLSNCEQEFRLCLYRYQNCQSVPSSIDELKQAHQLNPGLINLIVVHENRVDLNKAELRFWQNYQVLINRAPNAPPVRYLFFTWPADQIRGQARDVKTKATVCDHHCFYLATLLGHMKDFNQLSLCGYSYGARMALDAMHMLGGGTRKNRSLPVHMTTQNKNKIRAVMIATAAQNSCKCDRGFCREAYGTIDQLMFLNNSSDNVLRFFSLMPPRGRLAIGRDGLSTCKSFPDGGKRLRQIDTSIISGRSHKLEDYYKSEFLRQLIRDNLFWRPIEK